MTENWHGIDVSVNARLRNGLTVQGGTSTGRRLQDNCDVRAALPETYSWASTTGVQTTRVNTSTGALGQPMVPRGRAIPDLVPRPGYLHRAESGRELERAHGGATRAELCSQLRGDQRHLRCRRSAAPSSGNVTVNLVEPGTLYGARQNNIDMRIAKILRFGGTRAQFGVDVYNLMNTDVVTTYNEGYTAPTATSGSIWLTPNAILPARYVRLNMQLDF